MGLGFQFRRLSGIAKFLPRFSHSRIINQQARNIIKSPLQYIGRMTEVEAFSKAIEELNLVQHELLDQNLGSLKTKKADVAMELYDSSLRNLLLYFPGCMYICR
ncbi:hypothetical protein MKX03_001359 [Papaver bracteatum]|nr:hypothetical protein MKX03_001359 [Papaver bracteatum]